MGQVLQTGSGQNPARQSAMYAGINKEKTAELINDGKIEGISTIRDESDRKGMRIVYVLKRDAIPNIVLNKLYKFTQLQSSFSVNNVALVNGRPQLLNLKQLIHFFVEHRHDVVVRRITFELKKAEQRAHILEGLIIASDNIDAVIDLIKKSSNADEARQKLEKKYKLSEIQAKAIIEMRLRQLTGLEQDKLREEYDGVDYYGPESHIYDLWVTWNDGNYKEQNDIWHREFWYDGEDEEEFELFESKLVWYWLFDKSFNNFLEPVAVMVKFKLLNKLPSLSPFKFFTISKFLLEALSISK